MGFNPNSGASPGGSSGIPPRKRNNRRLWAAARVCLGILRGEHPNPMNDTERIQRHHGGPHPDGTRPQRPLWKRMHHSAFFWVGALLMLLAMAVFVMTDGFLLRPRARPNAPAQGAALP